MRKPRILTIGNAAMTFICTAERFPEADDTLVSEGGLQIFPGGKGLNAALCCARLGADAVLCTRAGNDVYAKRIAEFCAKDSIDTRFVFFDSDNKTDLVQVFRAPGEACGRTIVFPGAGAALSPDNVEEAFTCYPDGVYICGETASENTYFAVSKAKEQKIPVFLDDVLMQYDDAGAERTVGALTEYAREEGVQILLFTCRKRDVSLVQAAGERNCVINL